MLDFDKDFVDENIRKKKDRKLSKHFDILLNNTKVKIVNFIIKDNVDLDRNGKIIRLKIQYLYS